MRRASPPVNRFTTQRGMRPRGSTNASAVTSVPCAPRTIRNELSTTSARTRTGRPAAAQQAAERPTIDTTRESAETSTRARTIAVRSEHGQGSDMRTHSTRSLSLGRSSRTLPPKRATHSPRRAESSSTAEISSTVAGIVITALNGTIPLACAGAA